MAVVGSHFAFRPGSRFSRGAVGRLDTVWGLLLLKKLASGTGTGAAD